MSLTEVNIAQMDKYIQIIEVFNNHQHIYVQSKRCHTLMTQKKKIGS